LNDSSGARDNIVITTPRWSGSGNGDRGVLAVLDAR
jgi:hypothetical protein